MNWKFWKRKLKNTGRVIDFTHRYWGHNLSKVGDSWAAWSSPRLRVGDTIITENGRFRVTSSNPCHNPEDMTFVTFINEARLDGDVVR